MTVLWKGGLIFSEDIIGRAWSTALCPGKMALFVVVASWNGGIFSMAEKHFPCDDSCKRPWCSVRMVSGQQVSRSGRLASVVTLQEETFVSRDDGMGQGIVCSDITGKEFLW